MKKVLITGVAGFIGSTLAEKLIEKGYVITGIDNLNNYYSVSLKEDRLKKIKDITFYKVDLVERDAINEIFKKERPEVVINLAAQAGVRYSIDNPMAYIDSNIVGFMNVLEASRHYNIKNFIYASSSSVYGANESYPFSVHDNIDHPLSLYAATKKSNELMAHTYSNLYKIPTTGLRFFTVYGPWGRPDMALFKFTKNIIEEQPIDVYNNGDMLRDFTYVEDIVEAISRLVERPAKPNPNWSGKNPDPATSFSPYEVFNIGNNNPVKLLNFIEAIEEHIGKKAIKNMKPLQPGDVPATYANVDALYEAVYFKPETNIKVGVGKFVEWYINYYNIKL